MALRGMGRTVGTAERRQTMTSLASVLLADVNVSIGVVAMAVGILLLVIVLVAVSILETVGEHTQNARGYRHR
jgi:hypothetical protein